MFRVFLSSTGRDLHECRALVYRAIEGLHGYHCVRMEDFGAWNETSDALCRRLVAECDLFVILAGPLYGSIGPAGLSYTEIEYDVAQSMSKPCLVFLTTEDFLIPAAVAETLAHQRKQKAFRRKIGRRVRTTFSSGNELATQVVQAIRNWEASPAEHSLVLIRSTHPERAGIREFRRPFLRFGRNPQAEVVIADDPEVSWEHGMLFKHEGQFSYRHLSRTNGTCIATDNRDVLLRPGNKEEIRLGLRNQLHMGSTTLEIEIVPSAECLQRVPTHKKTTG